MAKFVFLLATLCVVNFISTATANANVFCYYDSRSYIRETQGKMLPADLDSALPFCTHLVYGYAGIHATNNKLVSLNENLDLDQGHANYRIVTQLKRKYPALKVLLSVGGDAEVEETEVYKYNTMLETPAARTSFINSASVILKNYGFDGIDLAWQFPKTKPKKVRSGIGSFWHGVKKVFSGDKIIDEKSEDHKLQFAKLALELKNVLKHDNMILTASVLPNVNSSLYFDIHALINNLDFVILNAYDFYTPERNKKEADYTAPLYELLNRNPESNVQSVVSYWTKGGFPSNKLILSIPTFGRAWKMDSDSAISGVPPLHTDGPADEGHYTKKPGVLSYPEICAKLTNPNNQKGLHDHMRKVTDPSKRYEEPLQHDPELTKRFGTYAFRAPNDSGENGIWVGYEDPDTAGYRAAYVKAKGLGGVALNDLSMDDFRGLCSGDKFPILRSAKYRL